MTLRVSNGARPRAKGSEGGLKRALGGDTNLEGRHYIEWVCLKIISKRPAPTCLLGKGGRISSNGYAVSKLRVIRSRSLNACSSRNILFDTLTKTLGEWALA